MFSLNLVPRGFVPHDQRSENESSGNLVPRVSHLTDPGNEVGAPGAIISGMRHRCRLRSETGWAEFGYFLCYFKMVAPRALIFRPLVKGNEDSGNEIGVFSFSE